MTSSAKKYRLVPYNIAKQLDDKTSSHSVQQHDKTSSYSIQQTSLDGDMESILNDKHLTDLEKVRQYSQTLNKYLELKEQVDDDKLPVGETVTSLATVKPQTNDFGAELETQQAPHRNDWLSSEIVDKAPRSVAIGETGSTGAAGSTVTTESAGGDGSTGVPGNIFTPSMWMQT
jgi:hypothetical protein